MYHIDPKAQDISQEIARLKDSVRDFEPITADYHDDLSALVGLAHFGGKTQDDCSLESVAISVAFQLGWAACEQAQKLEKALRGVKVD